MPRKIKAIFNKPIRIIAIVLGSLLLLNILLVSLEVYAHYSKNHLNSISQITQEKLDLANTIYSQEESADISQRDYMLTNSPIDLTKYLNITHGIMTDLSLLKTKVTFYNLHQETNSLISLTNKKESIQTNATRVYQTSGIKAAQSTLNQSEYLTSEIADVTKQIENGRNQARNLYQNKRNLYENINNTASSIVIILDAIIVILTLYLVNLGLNKEKELEANQSEFINISSHQLRTPNTTIKQYLYLLRSGFYGKLSTKQNSVLGIIDSANTRSIAIANSLLYISKLEHGELVVSKKATSINQVLERSISNYQTFIKVNHLKLIKKIPSTQYISKLDENLLQMAFEILIDNCCRYTPRNKKLFINLTRRTNQYVISFKDQGIGFSQQDITKLFNKFSRLENAKLMHPDGTGVGLYLLNSIIRLENGTIKVKSTPNKGSTFTLYLPANQDH